MRRSKDGAASIKLHPQRHRGDSRDREIASVWRPSIGLRMRRRGMATRGPATPVPSWKLYENPFYANVVQGGGGGGSVSARKLAATLWELHEIPLPRSPPPPPPPPLQSPESPAATSPPAAPPRSPVPSPEPKISLLTPLPDKSTRRKSFATAVESAVQSPDGNGRITRQVAAMQSHVNRLLDKQAVPAKSSISKSSTNIKNTIDAASQVSPAKKPSLSSSPSPDGFSASSELLQRLQALEDQHSSATLASALSTELDAARSKVKHLEGANRTARREIESLLKKIADDKTGSAGKEQDRVKHALQSVRDEADEERKSKRRMELANKKLTRELGEAKMALSKALMELDKERKARELMEDVCDELAREIGDDKAEVEELKRESLRIRQEVEEERRMLQMAEVWREERVHMKLAEAREEIQKKLDLVEKLKEKLEEFLRVRRRVLDEGDYASQQADIREAEMLRVAAESLLSQENESLKQSETRRSDEIESLDDDLHSIDFTKEASLVKDRKLAEWNRIVEHRLRSDRRIYCSPESCGEIGECGSSSSGGSTSSSTDGGGGGGGGAAGFKQPDSRPAAKIISLAPPGVASNLGSFDTDTCTGASSEFDLPLQRLEGGGGEKVGRVRSSSSNSSVANGRSRNNLKSLVEWTKIGRQQQPNGVKQTLKV